MTSIVECRNSEKQIHLKLKRKHVASIHHLASSEITRISIVDSINNKLIETGFTKSYQSSCMEKLPFMGETNQQDQKNPGVFHPVPSNQFQTRFFIVPIDFVHKHRLHFVLMCPWITALCFLLPLILNLQNTFEPNGNGFAINSCVLCFCYQNRPKLANDTQDTTIPY